MEVAGRQADEDKGRRREMPLEEEQLWELAGIGKKIERISAANRILNGVITKMVSLSFKPGPSPPCIPCHQVLMVISIVPFLWATCK